MQKYQRLIKIALDRLSQPKPTKIAAILGSRQVGKTTLLMDFAAGWRGKVVKYLGDKLEDAILWRGKFADVKNSIEMNLGMPLEKVSESVLVVFDEIQKIPEAFDNIKVLHDNFKGKVKIAISGSSSLKLLHGASESLGGRVEIAAMYPLSFTEVLSDSPCSLWLKRSSADFAFIKEEVLKKSELGREAERALVKAFSFGFFPEAYLQDNIEEVKLLHQNYHWTYIEKDVRDLREVGNVLDFDLVWKIAHRINGQLLNYTNIAGETGLAFNTVKKYLSVLSASFNISLLSPFTHSIRRRLVKAPKLFSLDLGFFNHCLGLYGRDQLAAAQLIGRAFESIMVMEFFKQEKSFLMEGEPYFFRTAGGSEVDLVVEKGLELFAYEFKFSEKAVPLDFAGIKSLMESVPNKVRAGFVVSRQPYAERFADNLFAVPWWYFCA